MIFFTTRLCVGVDFAPSPIARLNFCPSYADKPVDIYFPNKSYITGSARFGW
jgi:hypothetical protein